MSQRTYSLVLFILCFFQMPSCSPSAFRVCSSVGDCQAGESCSNGHCRIDRVNDTDSGVFDPNKKCSEASDCPQSFVCLYPDRTCCKQGSKGCRCQNFSCFGTMVCEFGICKDRPNPPNSSNPVCGDGKCENGERCQKDCELSKNITIPAFSRQCVQNTWKGQVPTGCIFNQVDRHIHNSLATLWGSVQPRFVCPFQIAYRSPCGTVQDGAWYCPTSTSISYSIPHMNLILSRYGNDALLLLIAHEWGHHIQNATGLIRQKISNKQAELHADCLAAYFLAFHHHISNIKLTLPQKQNLSNFMCSIADHFPMPPGEGHGSCSKRRGIFEQSYALAERAIGNYMAESRRTGKNPCQIFQETVLTVKACYFKNFAKY